MVHCILLSTGAVVTYSCVCSRFGGELWRGIKGRSYLAAGRRFLHCANASFGVTYITIIISENKAVLAYGRASLRKEGVSVLLPPWVQGPEPTAVYCCYRRNAVTHTYPRGFAASTEVKTWDAHLILRYPSVPARWSWLFVLECRLLLMM